jgi:UDP-N-acetylmuramyl pentapeptide phosphotransferase/UDP-N-acetylglucosamine-1-phosphate transferase
MNEHISALLVLLLSFVICLVLTRFLVIFLTKIGVVDNPDERRLHKQTTPTGGGVAVMVSFILGFAIIDYILFESQYSFHILLPISILAAISLYDDIKELAPGFRLFVHIITAAYITYYFLLPHQLFHGELSYWADFIIAFIALAGFANIYNFMDGIDGITASESIHLSTTILILCVLRHDVILHVELISMIAALILMCSLAFIIYNWHPAHIFIGDVGTITIGILLGLSLMLIAASGVKLFVSVIIASLYYLGDGGLTILIRIIKKEKIWLPHVNHFFQQAIRQRLSHRKITTEIILCNYWLMMLSISALYYPLLSLLLAMGLVMRVLVKFSEKKKK